MVLQGWVSSVGCPKLQHGIISKRFELETTLNKKLRQFWSDLDETWWGGVI